MSINFPASRQEVIDRIKTDVQAELPQSNPFLRNSFYSAQNVGYGGRVYEMYLQMQQVLKEMFPDKADGEFLRRWGFYRGIEQNAATASQGFIVGVGNIGAVVPIGEQFQSSLSNTYTSLNTATIGQNINNLISLTFSAGTVTATTGSAHNYATGIQVTIAGAIESAYNGTYTIFVTSNTTFTYEISGSPSTPATGTPQASANTTLIEVISDEYGATLDLDSGETINFMSTIPGISNTAYVTFDGLGGGADEESEDDFRNRILDSYQNPNTPFNEEEIKIKAREVAGVTRVFVETPDTTTGEYLLSTLTQANNIARAVFPSAHGLISGMYISIVGADQNEYNKHSVPILVDSPTSFIYLIVNNPASPATGVIHAEFAPVQPGQVKVIFTRDNDPSIIPSGSEVDDVYRRILTILPAHTNQADLIVRAPLPVPVAFVFESITPDTATMQAAIEANLQDFFRSETVVGERLLKLAYDAAIFNTIDPETGEQLQNFELTSPTTDVVILSGELPTLQSVTF